MIPEFVARCQAKGVRFGVEGHNIRCRSPRGALGPGDWDTLRRHKSALVAYLTTMIDQGSSVPCCCCGRLMGNGRLYRCEACAPAPLPRVTEPCLVNGELRVPTGLVLTEPLYSLAVRLGVKPEKAAQRYNVPRERQMKRIVRALDVDPSN